MRKTFYLPALAMAAALYSTHHLVAQDNAASLPGANSEQAANLATDVSASQSGQSSQSDNDNSDSLSVDAAAQSSTNLDSQTNQLPFQSNSQSNLDAQSKLDAQSNLGAQTDFNGQTNLDAESKLNAQSLQGTQSHQSQSNINNAGQTQANNESWRYRDYQGRRWYWQGDRQTGSWSYFDNNRWVPYNQSAASGINAQGQLRSSGYRGGSAATYDGPYYFDNTGRRYQLNGNTYTPDQNWNGRVWNDDYSNSYQNYWNTYGSGSSFNGSGSVNSGGTLTTPGVFGPNSGNTIPGNVGHPGANFNSGASVGGAVGQAFGGQSGAQIGAGVGSAIRGGAGTGQNVGGAIGQAVGGQAGARAGAAIGGAIGQDR